MVRWLSLPDRSLSGTLTSLPAWNLRSKPSIGLTGATEHGTSLRISLASRMAASEVNRLTAPPGPDGGMRTWAERQVLAAIHAQARIPAFFARLLRVIHLGTIAMPRST